MGARDPSLLYLVKRLELAMRAQLDTMLHGSGITTVQFLALTVLDHHGALSAAQLARESFVTPQAMADILRALSAHGLIERNPNPESRREVLVRLSPEGHAFLGRYADPMAAIEKRMVADLRPNETAAFRRAVLAAWQSLS